MMLAAKKRNDKENSVMTCLILRFSTLGNVAMSVPILASLSRCYPEHTFVMVSRKKLSPMFESMPNVIFHTVDFRGRQKGSKGLLRLFIELRRTYRIDAVFDLQDVLRTVVLRSMFALTGKPVYVIDSGRRDKRRLVHRGAVRSSALPSEFSRYAATFAKAGLLTDQQFEALPDNITAQTAVTARFGEKQGRWIGIAPFAKYKTNRLPFRITKDIIAHYSEQPDTQVFLFGAGEIECEMLRQWASVFNHVTCVAGLLPLDGELALMRQLDLMLCMDSANQHLSSLVGLRALTIWGGTHPYAGFYGWKQHPDDILQCNLPCRPCSVHGSNRCKRYDFACQKCFTAEQIIAQMEQTMLITNRRMDNG